MRWIAALLLLTVPLAGCLGASPATLPDTTEVERPAVPQGATLHETDTGFVLRWTDVDLPLRRTVTIPEGVTLVRTRAEVPAGTPLFVDMERSETGRRRCNTPYIESWEQATTGTMTCSGLTAIDELPVDWRIVVQAPSNVPTADVVEVHLSTRPLDGPVADLDLDEISKPDHELVETQSTTVESFDGVELYVEVTRPEGEGPWPVILASSPYNAGYHASRQPSLWEYFVKDWAMRGYAVAVADVRGTGYSGGCMEVWGPNEQRDQKVLVEWAADQPWSTGDVGFYGQSYVGTTPTEAAVQAPDALDAIIAVAPVNDAYRDWHFGGVPNGEQIGSPLVGYQGFVGTASKIDMLMRGGDPARTAMHMANGVCDPALTARANDPRAIYDEFYEVRNFTARADRVEAATLYTHGFEDPNVKSEMAMQWFNELDSPKLGLFGHWTHQHPPRADTEALFLAWMEEHVKGKDLGLDRLPDALIRTDEGTHRTADAWPPEDPEIARYWPAFEGGELQDEPGDGEATFVATPHRWTARDSSRIVLETDLEQDVHLAGRARLDLAASLDGQPNAHVAAYLYEDTDDGSTLVTWGMANLAHRNGHDTWDPVPPGETVRMQLPFLPTDDVIESGHTLRLVVRSAQLQDWFLAEPGPPGHVTLHGGDDGTQLKLPLAPDAGVPTPATAMP